MSVAGLQHNDGRDPWDYYPTEPFHTWCLIDALKLALKPGDTVWEPAAGNGAITDVLVEHGCTVHSSDVRPMRSDVWPIDFLAAQPKFDFDWVITNPPFKLWTEFHQVCRDWGRPFALLMPIHYLPGLGRRDNLWLPHPPNQLVLVPRNMRVTATNEDGEVTYDKTSQFAHVWGVWSTPGVKPRSTRFTWASRVHPNEMRNR